MPTKFDRLLRSALRAGFRAARRRSGHDYLRRYSEVGRVERSDSIERREIQVMKLELETPKAGGELGG